jgi:hypothetical protein
MKISLQRTCDGRHPSMGDPKETCEARVEITLELPDRMPAPEWNEAWHVAMALLGWRRIGGAGADFTPPIALKKPGEHYIVPQAATWIVCPEHAKGTVCARCCAADCYCMGGPRFDVVIAGEDKE